MYVCACVVGMSVCVCVCVETHPARRRIAKQGRAEGN